MTRREVLAWLAARRPVPPDALRAGIEAVVSDAELSPLDPLPDQLALLGRQMLGRLRGRRAGGPGLPSRWSAAMASTTYRFKPQPERAAAGPPPPRGRLAGGRAGGVCP